MITLASAESRLLIAACVPREASSQETPPPATLRWDRVLQMASWHRLTPLLWHYLRRSGLDGAPPPGPRDELRAEYRDSAATSLIRETHLDQVLRSLADSGVPAMLLKGAALVSSVYPDPALRPMDDLDILVPAGRIREAQSVLEQQGYRAWGASLERDDDHRLAEFIHHFPLISPTGRVFVELHQHVVEGSPDFDVGAFWERAVRAREGADRPSLLLPAPEDLFLHVAIHFADDRIRRRRAALGQLADLAWIADRWLIDWATIVERARRYGQRDRLFLAMLALQRILGPVAPEWLIETLRPETFRDDIGDRFVSRVLSTRSAVSLEQFATGQRSVFPWSSALESFVRLDDATTPSRTRLRFRQAISRFRKLKRAALTPKQLWADLRLTRWILTLRTTANRNPENDS